MTDQQAPGAARGEPECVFCDRLLASDDYIASIRVVSRRRGHVYFGAHLLCLQRAVRPEVARFVDLADVPPGLDHFLTLPT